MASELNEVLSQSAKIINYIKNSALNTGLLNTGLLNTGLLNTGLLKALCDEIGCDHKNLLFHSDFRWLSRGEVLKRLYEIRKEVELFLIDKKSDVSHYFQDKEWVAIL